VGNKIGWPHPGILAVKIYAQGRLEIVGKIYVFGIDPYGHVIGHDIQTVITVSFVQECIYLGRGMSGTVNTVYPRTVTEGIPIIISQAQIDQAQDYE
jgi:hypothetical protein